MLLAGVCLSEKINDYLFICEVDALQTSINKNIHKEDEFSRT